MQHHPLLLVFFCLLPFSISQRIPAEDAGNYCSASTPCANGACCGASGRCGYGPEYCGEGCQSNCDAHAECGQHALTPGQLCPLNACCSRNGSCGITPDFCDASQGCQSNCGSPNTPSGSGNLAITRVVGYYESWASRRPCDARYPEDLHPNAYTHINFAFATIDNNTFAILPANASDTELYRRTAALKKTNTDLKVFISVDGWAFKDPPTPKVFSNMTSNSDNRQSFIKSLISFFKDFNFDGVDINWDYFIGEDRGDAAADKANYVSLLSDLRAAFDRAPTKYGLTVTLPSSYRVLQDFDIVGMGRCVDWFNMMSGSLGFTSMSWSNLFLTPSGHGLHATWNGTGKHIGRVASAHSNLTEIDQNFSLLWRNDIDPGKVVMGLAFYGRTFTLANSSCTSPGCDYLGPAKAGSCTNDAGMLSYSEIQKTISTIGVTPTWDKTSAVKYFVWGGDQWVSYDDPDTLNQKIDYANGKSLGGLAVWSVDLDDDHGHLSAIFGKSPQLNKEIPAEVALTALSGSFSTGQICTVSDCNTGNSCQSGYTALAITKGKSIETTYKCPTGQHREVCCPSSAVPQGCTWRGGFLGWCDGTCLDGEVTLARDYAGGGGVKCFIGTKALCCPETTEQTILRQCDWFGTAPLCRGECPTSGSGLTNQVTTGSGGGGNGKFCLSGQKALCCPNPDPYQGCAWHGTAPICNGQCPDGKVMIYSDSSGDGWLCLSGMKVYCCDPPSALAPPQFVIDMNYTTEHLVALCTGIASDARRSEGASVTHRATHGTRHLDASSDRDTDETIESAANASIARGESTVDFDTFYRFIDAFSILLMVWYKATTNSNFGSLTAEQLAQAEAFQRNSDANFGGVSLEELSTRLHDTLQASTPLDPLYPQADVEDMICAGNQAKIETLGMSVLSDTVCMAQKCGVTPSVCLTSSARGIPDGMETLINRDEADYEGGESLKRAFDQDVNREIKNKPNGVKPTLSTGINAILDGKLAKLEHHYFTSRRDGADAQLEVVYEIGNHIDVAQYFETTKRLGWADPRLPDRVVVVHFHFAPPLCGVDIPGQRIQVTGINLFHGYRAGVGINDGTRPDVEVGYTERFPNNKKNLWGQNQRAALLGCTPLNREKSRRLAWSIEDCINPQPLTHKTPDLMSRSDLASRLVQKLRTDNILVWEDGLSDLWDPNKGPDGGWKTNFNGPRYGPGPSPDGRLNRGPTHLKEF